MTDLDRAERVLADAGEPLHVTDLAAQVHAMDWKDVRAATLDAILSAKIGMTIRQNGSESPFVRVGPSIFAHRSGSFVGEDRGRAAARGRALPFAPSAARAVAQANREAAAMDHERIEAGHLLAGVASLDEGAAASVLARFGVERQELIDLLRGAMKVEGSGRE